MLKQTVDIVFTVLIRVKLNVKYPVPWTIRCTSYGRYEP